MRRLSRRLSELTRLKSIASLLVGFGLTSASLNAHAISLLTPGTTTYSQFLSSVEPIDIGEQHTVVLDVRDGDFILDASLNNRGTVHVRGPAPYAFEGLQMFSPESHVNQGRWIIDQVAAGLGAVQNDSGVIEIREQSLLVVFQTLGGRIQGTDASSQLQDSLLRNATLAGHLHVKSTETSGTLTIEGQVQFSEMHVNGSTTLKGNGHTVLRGASGNSGATRPPYLLIGAGHSVDAAGPMLNLYLINQGQLQVAAQQTLNSDSSLLQMDADARLIVQGDLRAKDIDVSAGTIDLHNSGLVTGDVDVQQGRLVLHNFTELDRVHSKIGAAIEGDLTLSDQSQLEVLVGQGDPFALLEVWGNASLDGELVLTFLDGVRVSPSFEVIFSANSLQGSFRSLRVNGTGALPWSFVQQQKGGQLTVTITAVPEPQTWGLMLCGVGVIGWRLRRRTPTQTAH